jgi:PBSX family phage terminase large subunit
MAAFSQKSVDFIRTPPSQDAFMTILQGAVRSSKTWTMIPKTIFGLNTYNVEGDRVIFGKSKETIYNNVLNTIFDFVGPKGYTYNRSNGELWLKGVRWSVVGAKDEGSEQYIRGRTIGLAYGDEITLTPKSFTDMLLSRMSPEGARFYGTTNPDSPYHYIYTDYINDADKLASGLVRSIQFTMDDNLSLSSETRKRYEQLYKGVFYQRFIKGLWVIAEGAIYKDVYTEELLYDDDDRPSGLFTRGGNAGMYVPIDYGTSNPTVFLLVIDDGDTYWIDREYYYDSRAVGVQKTDAQYIADLQQFLSMYCLGAEVIVDPSAASFKAEMTQKGIWHCNAKNEVLDGIRTVSTLLGKKKIRIHRRCKMLQTELQTYSWDTKAQTKGEDKPLKEHDHAPDALRYFCETEVPAWRSSL